MLLILPYSKGLYSSLATQNITIASPGQSDRVTPLLGKARSTESNCPSSNKCTAESHTLRWEAMGTLAE